MNTIFAGETLSFRHPSIFLAGPTPRSPEVLSWRPEALDILTEVRFSGVVVVPERRDWLVKFSYQDQVEWEYQALEICSVIAFWVPRHVHTLPGFTTNVEFGRYVGSGRCVYGRPDDSPHTGYLDWLYTKLTGRQPENSLRATLALATKGR